jgi:FimV-like protein
MMVKTQALALLLGVWLAGVLPAQAQERYGPVRRGEDLWDIARHLYPAEEVSRDQVMLALLRANPQAFEFPCNANSPLQVGVVLRVPTLAEVTALSQAQAQRAFEQQLREWEEHRLTGQPLICPPGAETAPAPTAPPTEAPVAPPPPPATTAVPATAPPPATPEQEVGRMNNLEFTTTIGLLSVLAGLLGSLTGLGGGVMIVPLLTLGFGVDIRYAVGASLISVIATSSGAASAFVKEGYTNFRVSMFLEVATTLGAISGAHLAATIPIAAIAVLFGMVLLWSVYSSYRRPQPPQQTTDRLDPLATRLGLHGSYPVATGRQSYLVYNVPGGFALMYVAGLLSGLLGIGSGALKVLAMDRTMRIPFTVSTTTSNFMIGVTAAASAAVYLHRGYIDPGLAMPVMLGVLSGSILGARILSKVNVSLLRLLFSILIAALGLQMIYKGLTGEL